MAKVIVDKGDMIRLLCYLDTMGEKKHYEENGKTKDHIYVIINRLMKQVGYVEEKD